MSGKVPNISHLKPFGCHVTILNTSDHLGKFEGKADEGFIVRYAAHSKAYRVYNLSNKKIEETLNLRYLEDKPNVQGLGQEWSFDLDYLTDSLGYTRFKSNQPAGTQDLHIHAGTQDDSDSECDEQVIVVPSFPSNSFSGHKIDEASDMVNKGTITQTIYIICLLVFYHNLNQAVLLKLLMILLGLKICKKRCNNLLIRKYGNLSLYQMKKLLLGQNGF
ncbi:hypothetical protein Tco_0068256 [Tanacetum coccineum]